MEQNPNASGKEGDLKMLFVRIKRSCKGSGGEVITERNRQLLFSYFGSENFSELYFDLKKPFAQFYVERALKKCNDDFVFLDSSVVGYFSESFFRKHKVFSFFHNVESLYYRQKASSGSILSRLICRTACKREQAVVRGADKIISINNRDSMELERIYGRHADFILHSSMNDRFVPIQDRQSDSNPYILFVGIDFYGNTEGLFLFIENCMRNINCTLVVAGSGMDKYSSRYDSSYKTRFYGFVDDLGGLYANAAAVVIPVVSGSGMKTKTCEALMYGKVIFGTAEAFEGYDNLDYQDCTLCTSWDNFTERINAYLRNVRLFSVKNRQTFQACYSNKAVSESFFSFLNTALKSESGGNS